MWNFVKQRTDSLYFPFIYAFQKFQQRNILSQGYLDEKLGGAAREAKERLDERLGTRKSESKR